MESKCQDDTLRMRMFEVTFSFDAAHTVWETSIWWKRQNTQIRHVRDINTLFLFKYKGDGRRQAFKCINFVSCNLISDQTCHWKHSGDSGKICSCFIIMNYGVLEICNPLTLKVYNHYEIMLIYLPWYLWRTPATIKHAIKFFILNVLWYKTECVSYKQKVLYKNKWVKSNRMFISVCISVRIATLDNVQRPMKAEISLRIRAVWSEPSLSICRNFASLTIKCAQWRFWSDCANAQSDLNLR